MKKFRLPRSLEVLLGLVVLIELVLPLFKRTAGLDASELILLVGQYSRLVAHGVLLPRWAPDGFYGFGVPSFYFYPPVAFYLCALVRVITGLTDPYSLFHAASFLATIGSFFTARVLLKILGSRGYQMNIGAIIYTFAPYRLAELYSRSSITCHVGYVFLPLVWAGLVLIVNGESARRMKGILLLGVSSALIALTNVPLMLITAGSIGLAAIVCWRLWTRQRAAHVALAVVIAAGLAAFHFSSVLAAQPQTQLKSIRGVPEYLINDLLQFGNLPTAYHEGLIYLAVLIAAIAFWRARRESSSPIAVAERTTMRLGIVFTLVMIFLETPFLSWTVWYHILILELTVGAERYYIQLVLFAAVIIGIARSPNLLRASSAIVWVWTIGALFPALLILFNVHLFSHLDAPLHDPTEYLPAYTVREGDLHLLRDHQQDPMILADFAPGDTVISREWRPVLEQYDASLRQPVVATFHQFYWPQWHLYMNDREIRSTFDSLGRAKVLLPAGHYQLSWQLQRSPLERAGIWVSSLTFLGVAIAAGGSLVQRRKSRKQ
ncbi:MAG: hypothetical protein Q8922_10265 [Bacteroidota bacterium]|nr:hypothetical protein [Bacteroidota bacterium]MDP4233920.1 hypothetical protein [Bacteroidota bacterium]MDP4242830.1 hypothetical protein [Bacteroidota bacterium]MDP4288308.1 hypothetical protein [Bacteroidota bacterium]